MPKITPEQAGMNLGNTVRVEGTCVEVVDSTRHAVYLNFGGKYPRQEFTAAILPRDVKKWDNLSAFQDKHVVVVGIVEMYLGKPEIVVTDPRNLFIFD